MPFNGHVVGRVGEHHLRPLGSQQAGITLGRKRVGAKQEMLPEQPKVARACHRRRLVLNGRYRSAVLLIDALPTEVNVDLADFEAGILKFNLWVQFQDLGELELERRGIPFGVVGDAVERKAQSPQSGLGDVA
jgi:hypothetical protein